MTEELVYKYQKLADLMSIAVNTAGTISNQLRQLPKTGKRRCVFRKTYNRRPMNKRKTATIMAGIAMTTLFGVLQTMNTLSQPIPKYKRNDV